MDFIKSSFFKELLVPDLEKLIKK